MTNDRAVEVLKAIIFLLDKDDYSDEVEEAIHTAINVLTAQPERIQNNAVHLCDSCQYTYVTCPSHGNDAFFGDGKGNDNICACNKYRPISAQPERKKGRWIHDGCQFRDGIDWMHCSECGHKDNWNAVRTPFCAWCGARMEGEK